MLPTYRHSSKDAIPLCLQYTWENTGLMEKKTILRIRPTENIQNCLYFLQTRYGLGTIE